MSERPSENLIDALQTETKIQKFGWLGRFPLGVLKTALGAGAGMICGMRFTAQTAKPSTSALASNAAQEGQQFPSAGFAFMVSFLDFA